MEHSMRGSLECSQEAVDECSRLYNSTLSFKQIGPKSIELTLTSETKFNSLFVELVGSKCNASCDGTYNDKCNLTNIAHYWLVPELLAQPRLRQSFTNLSYSFNCLRIGPINECCKICTNTLQLERFKIQDAMHRVEMFPYIEGTMILSGTLAALFFLVLVLVLLHLRTKYHLKKRNDAPFERLIGSKSHEILLLYPYDWQPDLITWFKKVITEDLTKRGHTLMVWDPFHVDERYLDEIDEDPVGWIQSKMQSKAIKIVLVECDAHRSLKDRKCPVHRFGNLYARALMHLKSNDEHDHLFVVRFDLHPLDTENKIAVPTTSFFRIPDQLESFTTRLLK